MLDKLPLTHNNKIDRNILPIPKREDRRSCAIYIPPITPTEKILTEIWGELLELREIGLKDNFFELGGTSISITDLIVRVKKFFHIDVSLNGFLQAPTIENLSHIIDNGFQKESSDLKELIKQDSMLPKEIVPASLSPRSALCLFDSKPGVCPVVLLTGATGFLGIHLLMDLLRNNCKVYCLIRAKNHDMARKRLENALLINKVSNTEEILQNSKLTLLVGDLAEPQFGLLAEAYSSLALEVQQIYHCGAHVNHIYDYHALREANVIGTLSVLKLASTGILKKIIYFSTLSAVEGEEMNDQEIQERFIGNDNSLPSMQSGGYAQTKWVAERLMMQAQERGIPVNIIRVCCWLLGDSITGASPTGENHFLSLIKCCLQMKCAPNWDFAVNILPVNIASSFSVEVSLREPKNKEVYNLCNTLHICWKDLLTSFCTSFCYGLEFITPQAWQEKLRYIDSTNALYPFLSHYLTNTFSDQPPIAAKKSIVSQNTENAFKHLGLSYPEIDDNLLQTYFSYWHESGFLGVPLVLQGQNVGPSLLRS